MKKILKIVLIVFIVYVILSIISISTRKYKIEYDVFDTKDYFGNAEYQLCNDHEDKLYLFNAKYNNEIINSVVSYIEKDEKVYFKGYNWHNTDYYTFEVFVVLDLETNEIKYFPTDHPFDIFMISHYEKMASDNKLNVINSFDEFTEEEKNILNSL